MSSIVAVGPVGYDDVETPHGSYRRLLGGSAVSFALAAAVFAPTRIVAAVGSDLAQADLDLLAEQGVDVGSVVRLGGKTHRWAARYAADLSSAQTLVNDLGVMETWLPVLPAQRPGDLLYIGSLDPHVQLRLAEAAAPGVFTVFDTQSHWIAHGRGAALDACARCTMACLNESELLELTGAASVPDAAATLLERGTAAVVAKAGARGATLFHAQGTIACPGLAANSVEDPTGAGDAFAGGMAGHLAATAKRDLASLSDALAYGVATGSLAVERPAGERRRTWSLAEVRRRRDLLPGAVRG